jgi:hypothetical protein
LVYFTAILYILLPFVIFAGNFGIFFQFRYVAPRQIWQPWTIVRFPIPNLPLERCQEVCAAAITENLFLTKTNTLIYLDQTESKSVDSISAFSNGLVLVAKH